MGRLGVILAHFGPILGPSWAILEPSWAILGPSWAILRPSWGHLGAILGHLGAILDGHVNATYLSYLATCLPTSEALQQICYGWLRKASLTRFPFQGDFAGEVLQIVTWPCERHLLIISCYVSPDFGSSVTDLLRVVTQSITNALPRSFSLLVPLLAARLYGTALFFVRALFDARVSRTCTRSTCRASRSRARTGLC